MVAPKGKVIRQIDREETNLDDEKEYFEEKIQEISFRSVTISRARNSGTYEHTKFSFRAVASSNVKVCEGDKIDYQGRVYQVNMVYPNPYAINPNKPSIIIEGES